jgi:hypothetical protein
MTTTTDTHGLILCTSPWGWSLHAPGATNEQIREGDAPPLLSGEGRPTQADYDRAWAVRLVEADPAGFDSYVADFLDGYLECAMWCGVYSDDGTSEPDLATDDLLTDAQRAEIETDCRGFVLGCWADLESLPPSQAGHDFYLTRNGHGAGFWDRGLGDAGDRLTRASKVYGPQGFRLWTDDDDNEHLDMHG